MGDERCKQVITATPTTLQFNDAPRSYQVEHFAIGLEKAIDVEAVKEFFSRSVMLQLPRFTSLLVKPDGGQQYWMPTRVDIERHFTTLRHDPELKGEEAEDAVNAYLAELAWAPPLDTDKPLWEIHVLVDLKCLVLRVHHAIGDGSSLASLIREIGSPPKTEEINISVDGKLASVARPAKWRPNTGGGMLGFLNYTWFSMLFLLLFILKLFFLRDKKTVLNARDYVPDWPQRLATAKFKLEDVKLVKTAIPNATINDILCGIIWGGFMKYINARSSTALKEGQQITGILMANLRPQSEFLELSKLIKESSLESWWGNKTGVFLLPIYYIKNVVNPLDYVSKAKLVMDRKKQTMEPRLILMLRNLLIPFLGIKVFNNVVNRGCTNATFGLSNVVGPTEQISIADNPVKYLRLSLSTSPMIVGIHHGGRFGLQPISLHVPDQDQAQARKPNSLQKRPNWLPKRSLAAAWAFGPFHKPTTHDPRPTTHDPRPATRIRTGSDRTDGRRA